MLENKDYPITRHMRLLLRRCPVKMISEQCSNMAVNLEKQQHMELFVSGL